MSDGVLPISPSCFTGTAVPALARSIVATERSTCCGRQCNLVAMSSQWANFFEVSLTPCSAKGMHAAVIGGIWSAVMALIEIQ